MKLGKRRIVRDMILADAVNHIAPFMPSHRYEIDDSYWRIYEALNALTEHARRCEIMIWGMKDGSTYFELIPPSYWEEFGIDYTSYAISRAHLSCYGDISGRTRRIVGTMDYSELLTRGVRADEKSYINLWTSSSQIKKLWPDPPWWTPYWARLRKLKILACLRKWIWKIRAIWPLARSAK